MFYSVDVLGRKGRLSKIWLAATYGHKGKRALTYQQYAKINIPVACDDIANPPKPFALRLSSHLMVGVVRIYKEQTNHLCTTINNFWKSIRALLLARDDTAINLPNPNALRKGDVTDETCLDDLDFISQGGDFSPLSNSDDNGGNESPYQAPREKITLQESLDESPFKVIKVPGELDFSGERLDQDEDAQIFPPDLPESPLPPIETSDSDLRSPRKAPAAGDEPLADDDVVVLADEETGEFRPVESPTTPAKEDQQKPQEVGMTTPPVPIPEYLPSPPRKRKTIAVDENTQMDRKVRLLSGHQLEKESGIGSTRTSAKELFSSPSTEVLQNSWFVDLWRRNAITQPYSNEEFLERDARATIEHFSSSSDDEPEIPRAEDISDVEIPRRDVRDVSSDFEMSNRSGLETTPDSQLERSSIGEHRQPKLDSTPQRKSSITMSPGLSPIIDREIEDIAEIDDNQVPLPTIGEQPTFMEDEVPFMEDEVDEQMIPTKILSQVASTIHKLMRGRAQERLQFDEILPLRATRVYAGKTFYQLLVLNNVGEIILHQEEPYAPIFIEKGPHYGELQDLDA